MWIDTAGTLPAGSQLTVLPSIRLSCLVPIDSCSTVPSNQRWSRSASPFKTPPRSQPVSVPVQLFGPTRPEPALGSYQLPLDIQCKHVIVCTGADGIDGCSLGHRPLQQAYP
ncbi:hypothetical protein BASA61_010235 [Batrachochytrium salamandrivorans]|nr:hypothetical protein BASA62_004991 [Batrachochytrium salamandrivorans]KAH6579483.1 hypothetical protein BASA61_010235 [Batrachochytrium salamandrivorans]